MQVPDYQNVLANFMDGLRLSSGEKDLRAVASQLATDLGFKWFAYLRQSEAGVQVISTYPRMWLARYKHLNYSAIDPVLLNSRRGVKQLTWVRREIVKSPEQRQFFSEAESFGIAEGITIPIKASFGDFAAFTVSGTSLFEVQDPTTQLLDNLSAATLFFHVHTETKLNRGALAQEEMRLTMRERQCLGWASRGKTMVEIAALLGIQHRTVCHHLAQAKMKLGANSLAHATALAIKFGEISI